MCHVASHIHNILTLGKTFSPRRQTVQPHVSVLLKQAVSPTIVQNIISIHWQRPEFATSEGNLEYS